MCKNSCVLTLDCSGAVNVTVTVLQPPASTGDYTHTYIVLDIFHHHIDSVALYLHWVNCKTLGTGSLKWFNHKLPICLFNENNAHEDSVDKVKTKSNSSVIIIMWMC